MRICRLLISMTVLVAIDVSLLRQSAFGELKVGAFKIDITPDQLPVLINGSMTSHSADQVTTRVNGRAIVVDDGTERIAIVVVDSCMLPRDLLDEVKNLASTRTKLRADRILISATHTHSAPSSMGALGTDADPNYVPLLRQRLVEAIVAAEGQMVSATVGWGSGQAPNFTALRRWVRRPDRIAEDPFGNPTVRANMHSARNPDDATGPTGPEDPELSMIAFRTLDGAPIATLANFSMHYFGDKAISSDYFGLFCDGLERHMKTHDGNAGSAPVAIMSHGCSGDIWKKDYLQSFPEAEGTIQHFAQGLLSIATDVYDKIEFRRDADLAMEEARLAMRYRTPDAQRLKWARDIVAEMGDRLPKTQPEIYAREQVLLHERQSTEVVLQAIRIGDIAIASTPNETYALTGLKLKRQSPLSKTMVIELANGGDGYIPPPEQHYLGGYNTWAARSAGLEISAEPRIVAANLLLLERVSKLPRRSTVQTLGPAAQNLLDLHPLAYWRLDEMSGPTALDSSGAGRTATYEPGVIYFLEGPGQNASNPADADRTQFTSKLEINRAAHFAGGRISTVLPELGRDYSVVLSFWNGMPLGARSAAGWMFSRDYGYSTSPQGLHLGLAGDGEHAGKLMLQSGLDTTVFGKSTFKRWSWGRLVLVKSGRSLRVYAASSEHPEIELELSSQGAAAQVADLFMGGRSDNNDNWEGKLDEIAIFDRGLNETELAKVFEAN